MELLLYLAILTVPMGDNVLSLALGANILDAANVSFTVTLFRGFLLLALAWGFYQYLLKIKRSKTRTCYKPLQAKTKNAFSRLFLLGWLAYAAISVLWVMSYGGWVRQIYFIALAVLLTWLFCKYLNDKKKLYRAVCAFQLGILVQALIGWYEVFTRNYHWLEMTPKNVAIYVEGSRRIPIAMAANPNNFATLMLIGVALALICLFQNKERWQKIVFGVIAASESALIVLTTSRANILGLALMAFLLILCTKNKWIIIATLISGALLLAFPLRGYLLEILHFNFGQSGSSDNVRANLIKNGFIFLGKSLGFGLGAGQTEYWMGHYALHDTSGYTNMHNFWMEILVNYGLIIAIFFVIFYVRFIWQFWKKAKGLPTNDPQRWTYWTIIALMIGFIVAAISISSILNMEWLWVGFALLIAYQGVLGKYPQTSMKTVRNSLNDVEFLRWHDYFGMEKYLKSFTDKMTK